jgi:LysM repeat protein
MMHSPKQIVAGIGAVAAVAALCAVGLFIIIMILANRQEKGERSVSGSLPEAVADQIATPVALLPAATPANEPSATAGATTSETSPPTAAPDGVTSVPVSHIVQSGENLYRISLTYGVSVADIMAANGLLDPSHITAGQELLIPLEQAAVTPAAGEAAATDTALPSPSPTPLPSETSSPPDGVNGVAASSILLMPDNVRQSARQIYARGQELGRNPAAYSKLGDSTIAHPYFMARFDEGPYDLDDYGYLQDVIDFFAGSHGRQGAGVRRGFHSWTVTDPTWADKSLCQANESPVACEIRLHNPSIMLIRLGANDAGVPGGFEQSMRQVIDITIEHGVIPVLGTKADRFEGSNFNNETLRRLAAEYQIPLWDFDLVAGTLPGRGLDIDGVHLTTFYAHNYTSPTAFQRGHSVHNLTALMALDAIWREVIQDSE